MYLYKYVSVCLCGWLWWKNFTIFFFFSKKILWKGFKVDYRKVFGIGSLVSLRWYGWNENFYILGYIFLLNIKEEIVRTKQPRKWKSKLVSQLEITCFARNMQNTNVNVHFYNKISHHKQHKIVYNKFQCKDILNASTWNFYP